MANPVKEVMVSNKCPWCNKQKKENKLIAVGQSRWQCQICGKHWHESALGQEYSIQLERGPRWVAEMKQKGLDPSVVY